MALQWNAKDKIFIITGGASGLGAEYVKVFLSQEAKAVVFLDIAEEIGKAAEENLRKQYNDKVVFIKCDVSKEEDITKAFDIVLERFKQIDVIINNAGIMNDSASVWRTSCNVNWEGLVSLTLNGIQHMRKDQGGEGGTIINVASTLAIITSKYCPIYSGSKSAVLHFSRCLTMDPFYQNTKVRVLTICFGATETPLLQNLASRVCDSRLGRELEEILEPDNVIHQEVDAAVAALVHMFQNGGPGTVWVSADNKPAKDLTEDFTRLFKELENLTM